MLQASVSVNLWEGQGNGEVWGGISAIFGPHGLGAQPSHTARTAPEEEESAFSPGKWE